MTSPPTTSQPQLKLLSWGSSVNRQNNLHSGIVWLNFYTELVITVLPSAPTADYADDTIMCSRPEAASILICQLGGSALLESSNDSYATAAMEAHACVCSDGAWTFTEKSPEP